MNMTPEWFTQIVIFRVAFEITTISKKVARVRLAFLHCTRIFTSRLEDLPIKCLLEGKWLVRLHGDGYGFRFVSQGISPGLIYGYS